MNNKEIHVVTGAFGYSGKYIAKRLLDAGYQIKTLSAVTKAITAGVIFCTEPMYFFHS